MRVVVRGAKSATSLAERLGIALGAEQVSIRGGGQEVGIQVDGEPDFKVVRVLDTVERWYDQAGVGSVEMWLGDRSYTFARWAPAQTWR